MERTRLEGLGEEIGVVIHSTDERHIQFKGLHHISNEEVGRATCLVLLCISGFYAAFPTIHVAHDFSEMRFVFWTPEHANARQAKVVLGEGRG